MGMTQSQSLRETFQKYEKAVPEPGTDNSHL
jgi:hypothetical protein